MAGTGWRTSLVRLVLGAGLLCAAWLLLGAGEARADDAPRGASTPSVSAAVGVTPVNVFRSAPAPAMRRAQAAVRAVIARPVGHDARPVVRSGLATLAQRPVLGTGLATAVQRPVLRTALATVATRVVRPVVHTGEATVAALVPVVDPLSHLPVVRRLPVAAAAETLAGQRLREPTVTPAPAAPSAPRGVATQSPPAADRAAVATTPTGASVVHRASTAVLSLTRIAPAALVASTSPGGDAPAQPGGQGGLPMPVPTSAGSCSATTDMALPTSVPVLPQPAYQRGFGQPSSSTGAPAKGPGNRPD